MKYFKVTRNGKWILTGEHSVLLGTSALVFPLPSLFLDFSFSSNKIGALSQEQEAHGIVRKILSTVKEYVGRDIVLPKGRLRVESSIPMSAGLGSSAAFCSCFGEFLIKVGYVDREELYELCKQMECLFHGESSGMDLSVVLANRAMDFQMAMKAQEIYLAWKPKFFLTDTGMRSNTSDCVKKVLNSREHPGIMNAIDKRMEEASRIAKKALEVHTDQSFINLTEAIELASSCFKEWQLCPPEVQKQMEDLKRHGARAVKPTGSGMGGFLLSLWEVDPPAQCKALPVFLEEKSSIPFFPVSVWEIDI